MTRKLFILLCTCLSLISCAKGCREDNADEASDSSKVVHLFIWGEYTSSGIFAEFERKTGIKVVETNFASNEELLAKMQAGADGYDLIIPSDYMITVMRQLNMLAPLDKSKIPNLQNVDRMLLNRDFDPENLWSLPYSWAITGIIYNKEKVHPPIKGYQDLFTREQIRYRYSLLDDMREAMGGVLKSQGQSINTIDEASLRGVLLKFRTYVKTLREFNSSPTTILEQGDVLAAQIYSNEALRLIARQPQFDFILPEDGYTMAIDNMAIPTSAKHKENAHALINFLLDSSINIQFATELMCAPVVKNAENELGTEMMSIPAARKLFQAMNKGEMIENLGEHTTKYDRIWLDVKVSND